MTPDQAQQALDRLKSEAALVPSLRSEIEHLRRANAQLSAATKGVLDTTPQWPQIIGLTLVNGPPSDPKRTPLFSLPTVGDYANNAHQLQWVSRRHQDLVYALKAELDLVNDSDEAIIEAVQKLRRHRDDLDESHEELLRETSEVLDVLGVDRDGEYDLADVVRAVVAERDDLRRLSMPADDKQKFYFCTDCDEPLCGPVACPRCVNGQWSMVVGPRATKDRGWTRIPERQPDGTLWPPQDFDPAPLWRRVVTRRQVVWSPLPGWFAWGADIDPKELGRPMSEEDACREAVESRQRLG